jgi:hypothetical protein
MKSENEETQSTLAPRETKMSGEKSGWHQWVPVVAAVITASAVVVASYIGADAKRQVETLKVENENLRRELITAQQELKVQRPLKATEPAKISRNVTDPAIHLPPSETSSQPKVGELTHEIDEIAITLTRAHLSEDSLIFDFQILNKSPGDKSLNLLGKRNFFGGVSRFIADGQEYEATGIRVGSEKREDLVRKRFVSNVPLNGQVTFKGVPREMRTAAALELAYAIDGHKPDGVFRFLNVAVE